MCPHFKKKMVGYWVLIFFLSATVSLAQTPQLNFTLTNNQTGTTKKYEAREHIVLGIGFRYSATNGHSFIARINTTIAIKLPNGNTLNTDGTQTKPDGTIIGVDGTQTKIDGTIITPDGTIFKTNGTIINPDGTVLAISLIVPELWFKTTPITSEINSRYKWKDFSPNNVPLLKITNGVSSEYTVGMDSILHYNFNPAIDLTGGNISKEIILEKSNLVQATILGVWGSKNETNNTDKFVFALNGRPNESVVFTKSNIFSSIESGKITMPYGNDTIKNLLALQNSSTTSNKARESSLRIASYYKSTMPNSSVWGEQQKAAISLGSSFQNTNVNNTSTFIPDLNTLEVFRGYTPEFLVFSKVLQPIERRIFESYLAIKYGVSLDKSYYSSKGKLLWDYNSNNKYNNRITGYGREDIFNLNQKMATTSYQEAPYFSDSCDTYMANSTLPSSNRLLVMGCQTNFNLNDGEYVLFGDNNSTLTETIDTVPGYTSIQRSWLVNINTDRIINNWVELSYYNHLATVFETHKQNTYMLLFRNNSIIEVELSEIDEDRSKIIFRNVSLKNGDKFTFAYKSSAPNMSKKNVIVEEELEYKDDIRVYYKDPADRKNITVRVETARPSAATIYVFDMAGRRMERKTLAKGCEARFADINIRMSGVYIVKIVTNDNEYSKKIIVN